jgi:transaldolase
LIQFAVRGNFPINITAIYTLDQIDKAYEMLEDSDVEAIVSVFAGSISDKFLDPHHAITYALKRFKDKPNVKILWAGCREVYAIQRAKDANCHIITVPDAIMDKLGNQKSLYDLSVERVSKFRDDALSGNLSIN